MEQVRGRRHSILQSGSRAGVAADFCRGRWTAVENRLFGPVRTARVGTYLALDNVPGLGYRASGEPPRYLPDIAPLPSVWGVL